MHISQERFHKATVCLFVLSYAQFDNHLSVPAARSFPSFAVQNLEFSEVKICNKAFDIFCLILTLPAPTNRV